MGKIQHWVVGLVSAALSGGANAWLTLSLVPGVHVDPNQWTSAISAIVIGAGIGLSNYLVRSPLSTVVEGGDESAK